MEDLKQKHNYEIMYIVDDQNQEKAQLIKKEFCEILTKNNGKIKKEQDSIRQFAYPINKKVKGHYFIIEVSTSAKNIASFNRIALNKKRQLDVMRYLVINLDNEKINKFKPKRQVESNSFSRSARTGNRPPYNREENIERKPRPIAGTESSYRKTNYQNIKPKTTDNMSSTEQKNNKI
ncbi:30S ribosomal protein S6 [Spiroplasma endosymbiont of Polydrusus pterygomalis]|uniref:30S ribosomal protein S6 n=1 Tax=Spiroplasma endosymbiont of Polydrusus pterygomalis TaxID=3139327 RepID=UPI003CCAB797